MQFIAETLKPYIDENFRTRPEPEMNALIGSRWEHLFGAREFPNWFIQSSVLVRYARTEQLP